ncbi:MAG: SURF1 family protein [Rhodocyclaceae bacterium]
MRARQLIAVVAGVLVCLLCARLGLWQTHRAAFKASLQQAFDAAGAPAAVTEAGQIGPWRRVQLQGRWLDAHSVFLDNRVRDHQAGFEVLTPLQLANGGGVVIVDRGWVAGTGDRARLPAVPAAPGGRTVTGLAQEPAHGFSLGESAHEPRVWQRVDLDRFARQLGQPVAPVLVRQEGGADDGLVRDWPRPDFGIDTHRGYALQWFSFAALAALLTAWFGWKAWRGRRT